MIRTAVAALLMMAGAGIAPAHATGTISCTGVNGAVSADLGIGTLPILSIISASISTPAGDFAINPQGGATEIIVGQAFGDDRGISADFTDPNVETILVSVRTVRAVGDKQISEAGVLTIEQTDTYAIVCEGP